MPYHGIDDLVPLRWLLVAMLLIEADLEMPPRFAELVTSDTTPDGARRIGLRPTGRGVPVLISDSPPAARGRHQLASRELRLPAQPSAHDAVARA